MIENFDYSHLTILFITGVILGSFLNVVIYRIPKSQSLYKPASQCPHCKHKIKWYENIPVISYIVLLGKCSNCKKSISFQYPIIEILNGLLLIVVAYFSANITEQIFFSLLAMTFLCLIVIDFKNYILPDILIIIGLILSIVYFGYTEQIESLIRFYYAILTGSGLFVLRLLTTKIYKKETFGLGDVKLSFLIGYIIGGWDSFVAIFFGFVLAAVIFGFLILSKLQKKDAYLPFGPYLIFGMVVYILYGAEILRWYIHLFM